VARVLDHLVADRQEVVGEGVSPPSSSRLLLSLPAVLALP
jgi:hypothetical protein